MHLMRNYAIKCYPNFPQLFWGWKTESADLFAFRMYDWCPDNVMLTQTGSSIFLYKLFHHYTFLGRHLFGSFLKHGESNKLWYFCFILPAAKWTRIWKWGTWESLASCNRENRTAECQEWLDVNSKHISQHIWTLQREALIENTSEDIIWLNLLWEIDKYYKIWFFQKRSVFVSWWPRSPFPLRGELVGGRL